MQHETPVEGGKALVHVHGEHLERDGLGIGSGGGGHGQSNNLWSGSPAKPPRCAQWPLGAGRGMT